MSGSRPTIFVLLLLGLTLAGCGAEEREQPESDEAAATATETSARPPEASEEESEEPGVKTADARAVALARRPPGEDGLRVPARRARIVAKESAFGRVLFDLNGQAVYVFERDPTNRSNCTSDECVEAWPPVLTEEQPSAGAGVEAGLLGTIRRSEGRLQVTYNGRPLYFYEHEGRGEIQCHNVDLHGGLWWVITPRGDHAD
jgi:predicted lipoprotein with Yx(FWY)xxD motif